MSMKKNSSNYGLIVVGLILFALFLLFPALNAKTSVRNQEATSESCGECHVDMAKTFQSTPHAPNACITCHDNPKTHLEEGGGPNIFAFTAENLATKKSEKCLTCHSQDHGRFFASPHGKSAMDCTSCHVIHGQNIMPALLKTSPLKNCSTCHQDVFAQFQLNERHRLQEGILSCSTCHDPHEPATRERLGGFKHEACLTCHTDKGGPFLYEHGASRIEGCTSCHEVHGSPNRHMLTNQSIADLCFSCHGVAPDWHSHFDSYSTNCTVCHAAIHGSNLSRIFLK
jgi:DmsE family decaheme c-type cytochrome